VSHLVQQRRPNLSANLRLAGADGLDVSLVKENPVGRTGRKDALHRAGDAVKKPQQQPSVFWFLRRLILHDDCHVGELLMKPPGQAVQGLRDECLELVSFHPISNCSLVGSSGRPSPSAVFLPSKGGVGDRMSVAAGKSITFGNLATSGCYNLRTLDRSRGAAEVGAQPGAGSHSTSSSAIRGSLPPKC
jgi:hypothetical protein